MKLACYSYSSKYNNWVTLTTQRVPPQQQQQLPPLQPLQQRTQRYQMQQHPQSHPQPHQHQRQRQQRQAVPVTVARRARRRRRRYVLCVECRRESWRSVLHVKLSITAVESTRNSTGLSTRKPAADTRRKNKEIFAHVRLECCNQTQWQKI